MTKSPGPGESARESSAGETRVGALAAMGLFTAGVLSMLGIVLVVNPGRYGTIGAFVGVALLAVGGTGTFVCLREPRSRNGRPDTKAATRRLREITDEL